MVKYANPPNQSKGILDDFAVRKNVATREGTVEKTPVNDSDIVNKKYVDDEIDGKIEDGTATGQMSFWDSLWKHTETSELFWDDVNKRLGIGIATPERKLHVYSGDSGGTPDLRVNTVFENNDNDGFHILVPDDKNAMFFMGNATDSIGFQFQWQNSNDLAIIATSKATGEISIRTGNNKEAIRINDNGNVGIGTSTPNDELEVAGAIRVSTDSAYVADEARIYYDSALGLVLTGKAGTTNDFTVAGNNGHLMITQPQGTNHLCLVPTGGKVGIGTATPDTKLQVVGAIASSTLTVTASADNTDVSGVNTMFITTSGGSVIIGGFKGGVAGQVLYIARKDATNDLTLEHAEGVGTQDIIMHEGTDETIDNYGGFVLVCDGSDWYDCSHAKHV